MPVICAFMILNMFALITKASLLDRLKEKPTLEDYDLKFFNSMCEDNIVCEELKEELERNPNFLDSLPIRDVTDYGIDDSMGPNEENMEERSRSRRSLSCQNRTFSPECPTFDQEYLNRARLPRELSLSPWRWICNYDANRRPKKIPETECLCTGCIDPTDNNNENPNLRSINITVTQGVKYKNPSSKGKKWNDGFVTTNLGCRCDFLIPG